MYETIMDLPLMKGLSREQVSSLLEKVHVEFVNLNKGDILVKPGEICDKISFIISGKIRISMSSDDGEVILQQSLGAGNALGADRLFGIDTTYNYSAEALATSSVMQFSKTQYFSLLHTHPIYAINYCNYVSALAQRPQSAMRLMTGNGLYTRLAAFLTLYTSRNSTDIELHISPSRLIAMSGETAENLHKTLQRLSKERLATYDNRKLTVISRSRLLEKEDINS